MPGQQTAIYNAYVERTERNNVEPIIFPINAQYASLEGEVWTESTGRGALTNRWGDREYGRVFVYTSNLGRVMEMQISHRGMRHQYAIHRTHDDYWKYSRADGMFHHLYT